MQLSVKHYNSLAELARPYYFGRPGFNILGLLAVVLTVAAQAGLEPDLAAIASQKDIKLPADLASC